MTVSEDLQRQLAAPATRRTVVKTGVKLAYAAPLVAATIGIAARGAEAATCDVIEDPCCCRQLNDALYEAVYVMMEGMCVLIAFTPGTEPPPSPLPLCTAVS